MISVVICAREFPIPEKLNQNIQDTIGTIFELVAIDNSKNNYNICQAYNHAVSKSIYPYLCFIHEDILFETEDWGNKLIQEIETDPNIGIIGVAGCKARPRYPRNNYESINFNRGHIRQGHNSWHDFTDLQFGPE